MDIIAWTTTTSFLGFILPIAIEGMAKKITGKRKILVVLLSCLIVSLVQYGVEGGFQKNQTGTFLGHFMVISIVALNSWNQMWKKWFPSDPNPWVQRG